MARKIRITDEVVLTPVEVENTKGIKDNILGGNSSSSGSLRVRLAATHAGIITGNNTFYLPDRMKKGASTWTAQYEKPVLVHHDKDKDAIGRVLAATYVDLTNNFSVTIQNKLYKDSLQLKDTFKKFLDGQMDRKTQVRYIRDVLAQDRVLDDKNYQGLGYIELVAVISDQDAIQKIKDKRYLTGSVSASTDAANCSICEQDWIVDGKCDHTPGDTYDGVKAFLVAGDFEYEEYSFVNRPADAHSRWLELVTDGKSERISMVQNSTTNPVAEIKTAGSVRDSVAIKSHTDKVMLINMHNAMHFKYDYDMARRLAAQEEAREGDGAAHALYQDLPGKTCEISEDVIQLHTKLHQEAKAAGIDGSLVLGALDQTLPDNLEPPIPEHLQQEHDEGYDKKEDSKEKKPSMADDIKPAAVEEKKEPVAVKDNAEATPVAEPFTRFSDKTADELETLFNTIDLGAAKLTDDQAEIIYELMARELDSNEIKLSDAKLSGEKRKKLAGATFCGPDRSFPVPDCAHVTAARRLIGRYKGTGSKDSILSCVSRKASALGCGSSKDSVQENTVTTPVVDNKETSVVDNKNCDPCKETLAKAEQATRDAVAKKDTEITHLNDQLKALREEYKYLYVNIAHLEDELITAHAELRKVQAHRAVDMKRLSGVEIKDVKAEVDSLLKLDDKQLNSQVESVDIEKIVDKINSGLARTPEGKVTPPSEIVDAQKTGSNNEPVESAENNNQSNTDQTGDTFPKEIRDCYNEILKRSGPIKADRYLNRMKREGHVK